MLFSSTKFMPPSAFQSTPPVAGRRCQNVLTRLSYIVSFNPRLPLLGGDAYRPWWMGYWISFQSTPPVAGRRCRFIARLCVALVSVSIHASRCWEAMPRSGTYRRTPRRFQSTPPVAGRRCGHDESAFCGVHGFNPRLPLLGGDAVFVCSDSHRPAVSIHASRCWEAMLREEGSELWVTWFQSTPPVAGRRCLDDLIQRVFRFTFQSTPPVAGRRCVDRHSMSSPRWRFNPRLPLLGGDAIVPMPCYAALFSFNPRLPLLGGDAMCRCGTRSKNYCFNPRLPLLGGDASLMRQGSSWMECFNPRLPLLGGDAVASRAAKGILSVSIHASRCWEAMLIA